MIQRSNSRFAALTHVEIFAYQRHEEQSRVFALERSRRNDANIVESVAKLKLYVMRLARLREESDVFAAYAENLRLARLFERARACFFCLRRSLRI